MVGALIISRKDGRTRLQSSTATGRPGLLQMDTVNTGSGKTSARTQVAVRRAMRICTTRRERPGGNWGIYLNRHIFVLIDFCSAGRQISYFGIAGGAEGCMVK